MHQKAGFYGTREIAADSQARRNELRLGNVVLFQLLCKTFSGAFQFLAKSSGKLCRLFELGDAKVRVEIDGARRDEDVPRALVLNSPAGAVLGHDADADHIADLHVKPGKV